MPCLVDCIDAYKCGDLLEAFPGAIFAPYVELNFGGKRITVGNNSAPPNNHATISSFEFGFMPGSTGYGAKFEIIDQGGVMSKDIIKAINKTATLAANETMQTYFDFGWIIKTCDGTTEFLTATKLTTAKLHGMIMKVEQTYEGGKSKLTFTVEAPSSATTPEVRHDDTEGDEAQKITLKEALTALFTEHHPKFSSVEFKNKDGGDLEFKNSDGGALGPKSSWPHNQQNPLSVARTWLSAITSKDGKGILICYNPTTNSIVFQEDKSERGCCINPVGTYIVNGGNCSPVLEFNPTLTWGPLGIPSTGAPSGSSASGDQTAIVEPTVDVQLAGTQDSPAIQQHEWQYRHPESLASGASEGHSAQLETNRTVEVLPGFSAQLKIHGNPKFSDPIDMIGKSVGVIVINPFHIDDQCQWVVGPTCNPIMSNKNYMIQGVNHQISGGSYVTTLQLFLYQPNKDQDYDLPLGGEDCGTETFVDGLGASLPTDANE